MELQLLTIATQSDEPAAFIRSDCPPALAAKKVPTQPESRLAEILYEQLGHLIQYADQDSDRLRRVKYILDGDAQPKRAMRGHICLLPMLCAGTLSVGTLVQR